MISTLDRLQQTIFNQAVLQDGSIEAGGTLYFLDGQYLLRYKDGAQTKSKFITAQDVAAAFTQTDLDSGWLPAGMVRVGQKPAGAFFVYSAPAQKVEVQLSADETPIEIPIPRTVLLGIGPAFYLWALKSKYFSAEEIAYKAPFPNVHDGGRICWGQFSPPEALSTNARPVWELFFKTPFNADLAAGKSLVHKKDVREQLRGLLEKKTRQYPEGDLLQEDVHVTIGYLIEQKLRG